MIGDIFLYFHLEQCNVIGIACVDVAGMKNDLFDSQHFPDNDETCVRTISRYWCLSVSLRHLTSLTCLYLCLQFYRGLQAPGTLSLHTPDEEHSSSNKDCVAADAFVNFLILNLHIESSQPQFHKDWHCFKTILRQRWKKLVHSTFSSHLGWWVNCLHLLDDGADNQHYIDNDDEFVQ